MLIVVCGKVLPKMKQIKKNNESAVQEDLRKNSSFLTKANVNIQKQANKKVFHCPTMRVCGGCNYSKALKRLECLEVKTKRQ